MAYYSLHAYDADVWISRFAGLNKTATEVNGNPMFAEEECNLETPNGVLQPRAGMLVMSGGEAFSNIKIETLVYRKRQQGLACRSRWRKTVQQTGRRGSG